VKCISTGGILNDCKLSGDGIVCTNLAGTITTLNFNNSTGTFTLLGTMTASGYSNTSWTGSGTRSVCADNSGVFQVSGCAGGAPFSDGSALVKNASDATKMLVFSAAGISTGTTRTLTAQDNNYTIAALNIAQTFSGTQTFGGDINATTNLNMSGTLLIRASDRTLWNLGDFQGNLTMSADNLWNLGSAAKRMQSVETAALNARSSASASTGCFITGSTDTLKCVSTGGLLNDCKLSGDGIVCTNIAGTITTLNFNNSTAALTISGNMTAASFNGKKTVGSGSTCLSSGTATVSTGLSSIDSIVATMHNNGTPTEDIQVDTPSGGSAVVRSSNTGSGSCFWWMAIGNP